MLSLVRGIEAGSGKHPFGRRAYRRGNHRSDIEARPCRIFESVTGKGRLVGKNPQPSTLRSAMRDDGFLSGRTGKARGNEQADALRAQGQDAMYVAVDGKLRRAPSLLRTRSRQQPATPSKRCMKAGLTIIMATGDIEKLPALRRRINWI